MQKIRPNFVNAISNIIGIESSRALVEFIDIRLPCIKFFEPTNEYYLNNCKFFYGATWNNALSNVLQHLKDESYDVYYPSIEFKNESDKKRVDKYYRFIRDELEERVITITRPKITVHPQLIGAISAANDVVSALLFKELIFEPEVFADFALNHWNIYENGFCTVGQLVSKKGNNKQPNFYVYLSSKCKRR